MGVKRVLNLDLLPLKYQRYRLIPTQDGVMATVYLLEDRYVLKVFEPKVDIADEIKVLKACCNLNVPRVVDVFKIDNLEAIVYTQIKGKSIKSANRVQIFTLGEFLKRFHKRAENINIKQNLFSKEKLEEMIIESKSEILLRLYSSIELNLRVDGVIHGDLFLDNCKFIGDRLSGVFDFSQVSRGDFYFDLAVVAVGSCFRGTKLDYELLFSLLRGYRADINIAEFLDYIRYALLYYATLRYIANRDYMELIERFEEI